MIRYVGQNLPDRPRIAVVANDAIGNFAMATPLLQLLRSERAPERIVYFGGTRTEELQKASDLFEESANLHGCDRGEFSALLERFGGDFDLLVNLESTPFSKAFVSLLAGPNTYVAGPCAGPGGRGELPFADDARGELWRDKCWIAEDLTRRYPFLRSGFIAEVFARLCYLEGELPRYRIPSSHVTVEVPSVLVSTAASLPEKLWPMRSWRAVLDRLLRRGVRAGLLGARREVQGAHWHGASEEDALVSDGLLVDLRGRFTLPQVVGALGKAKACLTLDNGILHLAVAASTPTVGLFRHGIHRLWAPQAERLAVLTPGEGGSVADIEPERVEEALCDALR